MLYDCKFWKHWISTWQTNIFKNGFYYISWKLSIVKKFSVLNDTTECQFVDPSDDCTFYFLYYEDQRTDTLTVWVKEEKGKLTVKFTSLKSYSMLNLLTIFLFESLLLFRILKFTQYSRVGDSLSLKFMSYFLTVTCWNHLEPKWRILLAWKFDSYLSSIHQFKLLWEFYQFRLSATSTRSCYCSWCHSWYCHTWIDPSVGVEIINRSSRSCRIRKIR